MRNIISLISRALNRKCRLNIIKENHYKTIHGVITLPAGCMNQSEVSVIPAG